MTPSGNQDLLGDLETILAGFAGDESGLDFVRDWTDLERIAVVGHSAGGNAATSAADFPGVQVVVSMAGSGAPNSPDLDSTLFLGGMSDTVVSFSQTQAAYERTDSPRRLLGISDGAHLIFSDICELTNSAGQDLVEIATEAGVCGTQFASFLFDCAASSIPPDESNAIVKGATTWEFETHLHCDDGLNAFDDFGSQSEWIDVLENDGWQ